MIKHLGCVLMTYAGLDVGTSGCKLTVYDLDGKKLFQASRKYREQGSDGRRELDTEVVAANVLQVLEETGRNCPVEIQALAVASLGESVVCLDEEGNSLFPSMLTGDCRGIPETKWLIETIGAQRILEITGLPPNELYSLSKFIWMKRNTDAIDRAKYILFYEDYVGYLLTGKRMVSYSSACRSMAFDISKKDWSQELLALAGIRPEQMSRPAQAGTLIGTILPDMAQKLHLPPTMRVVTGGHDQSCAALGSGLLDARSCETSMGTCEFMLLMLPRPSFDEYMIKNDFPCIPYVLPNSYLSSLEVTTCGILKNWTMETFFSHIPDQKTFYREIESRIRDLRTEVLVLPQFGSRGNPDLSMDARGTITGLSIHTRPEEIYLAMLEGISFQLYLAFERLSLMCEKPERMIATGGGAATDAGLQIRADIFNTRVVRLESDETGTLGCMLLAALATGGYASLEEGIQRAVHVQQEFIPDPERVAYYAAKFAKYKELYRRMYDFQ